MEEEIIREQPELEEQVQSDCCSGTSISSPKGSLGKFKDTESLLNAYNSLQAEFTRKCQKLSELEKANLENVPSEKVEMSPIYTSENWKDNVSTFLKENAEAKEYSGEICNEILKDESLQKSPNALELAWARVMKKEYASPKKLANDQNFISEQILSQEQVKKQVLEEYFKNLQNTKTPPVISNSGSVAFATNKTPSNMSEAKQMVEKLFNLKGQ